MSIRTFLGDMMIIAPPAAPQMTMNSEIWMSAPGWPPAMTNPPRTDANTMIAPTMMIMSRNPSGYLLAVLLEIVADRNNRLRMDLTNARLGHAERLRDFAQTHIFEIVQRENFSLHFGKLLQALSDYAGEF